MTVTQFAQLVPLTNTGWTITGSGTAVQILEGQNPSNYLSATAPFSPPNTGTLIATDFGFAIPGGSTINSVVIGISYKNTGTVGPSVSLTKDGVTADGFQTLPSEGFFNEWQSGNLTGYTVAELNASTFGVMIDPSILTHYVCYLFVQVAYVPSSWTYNGSAVFGFSTASSYSFHPASGANSWTYNGSAVFGFSTASSYSFNSGASGPPYTGSAGTSPLYGGTAATAPLYSGTVETEP